MKELTSPLVLVVVAKKPAAEASSAEVRGELLSLLRKAGIIS
jgi:RNase P protein component